MALSTSLAVAEDFKTVSGKEYKNATVTHIEADGIIVRTAGGISKIYFVELPKDVADKWLAPVRAAERAAEENRIEDERAAEEKRAAAERERTERENKAGVELKPAIGQFQAAEQRASQAYQSAAKGTLSGQVFVSSSGGQSFKLGAVQVGLFARDAIDVLLPALKRYADFKFQELSPIVDAAKLAKEQSNTAAHREDYYKALGESASYYSGSFYFSYLQSPIQTAETDADGKFVLNIPKQGSFVLAARATRYVGKTFIGETGIDQTEYYYWLQPVSLNGRQQFTQNLSNNNLTSTTGTSSLIKTQD
jgi:sRNA-binding protein